MAINSLKRISPEKRINYLRIQGGNFLADIEAGKVTVSSGLLLALEEALNLHKDLNESRNHQAGSAGDARKWVNRSPEASTAIRGYERRSKERKNELGAHY